MAVYAQEDKTITIVGQLKNLDISSDQAVKNYLLDQHYKVNLVNQDVDPHHLPPTDLVIISSSVSAKDLKSGWRQLQIPLMTWENDYLDDLVMTGKRIHQDFGEVEKEPYLWLVNQPHPLSAHLNAGITNVYNKQAPMSWGHPGLGATIIATVYGQPEKVAIWGYEKGSTMDYETLAPQKRLMFFLGNDTFTNLSVDGKKLFQASIDWLLH